MKYGVFLIFSVILIFAAADKTRAQFADTDDFGRPNRQKQEMPQGIKEAIAKSRIEESKKEYAEMLERGEEAVRISTELEKSFVQNNNLSAADRDKLQQLEKLVRKIRGELGGDDDDDEKTGAPLSPQSAVEKLKDTSVGLCDELKKMTRYSISAAAIQSSNTLIRVARFLRGDAN